MMRFHAAPGSPRAAPAPRERGALPRDRRPLRRLRERDLAPHESAVIEGLRHFDLPTRELVRFLDEATTPPTHVKRGYLARVQ